MPDGTTNTENRPRQGLVAEADGNRTRQGTLAPSSVLKTAVPTRRTDASVGDRTGRRCLSGEGLHRLVVGLLLGREANS